MGNKVARNVPEEVDPFRKTAMQMKKELDEPELKRKNELKQIRQRFRSKALDPNSGIHKIIQQKIKEFYGSGTIEFRIPVNEIPEDMKPDIACLRCEIVRVNKNLGCYALTGSKYLKCSYNSAGLHDIVHFKDRFI